MQSSNWPFRIPSAIGKILEQWRGPWTIPADLSSCSPLRIGPRSLDYSSSVSIAPLLAISVSLQIDCSPFYRNVHLFPLLAIATFACLVDRGDSLLPRAQMHDHELYFQLARINLLVLLPLSLLGLLSNTSALVCLCTPPKISSGVYIYLKALLILDHLHILVSLASCLLPDLCDAHHSREHTFYRLCMLEQRFLRALVPRVDQTVSTLHVWTIASLSAHRYWKISRPVVSRFKDTVKRARSTLTFLFLAIGLYRLPTFLVELQWKWHPVFRIQRRPETTEMLSPYRVTLYSVLDPVLSNFLPFALMCIFSLLTLCEIVKSRHFAYAQFSIDSHGSASGSSLKRGSCSSQQLAMGTTCLRSRRADGVRQKQEYRATISIVLIIFLYLLLHSMGLYNLARQWQLLSQQRCPTRADYLRAHVAKLLSVLSSSVNAFVFIAFTHRMRNYIQMLIRKTSRSFSSNSSEHPPATGHQQQQISSPKLTIGTQSQMDNNGGGILV